MEELRFRVLGPLEVHRNGESVVLGGPKQRAVLAMLLTDPGRVVSTDRLAAAVWGETTHDMSDAVQVYVAKLRKAIDPDRAATPPGVIETVRPGYRVTLMPAAFDLLEFEEAVRAARTHRKAGRLELALDAFDRALDLWRGPFAEDLADFEFAVEAAGRLGQVYHGVRLEKLDCLVALGRHGEVIPDAERLVAAHAFDENLAAILMRALYQAGRQADALAEYRRLEMVLRDELGLQPGPDLQALELMILEQAPELSASQAAVVFANTTIRHGLDVGSGAFLVRSGEALPLIKAVTTIGRLPDRLLVVADPGVSRRHAEIRRTGDGFRLVDTGSTNGTSVNGARVADRLLEDGDVITVGATEIVFRFDVSAAGGSPDPG